MRCRIAITVPKRFHILDEVLNCLNSPVRDDGAVVVPCAAEKRRYDE